MTRRSSCRIRASFRGRRDCLCLVQPSMDLRGEFLILLDLGSSIICHSELSSRLATPTSPSDIPSYFINPITIYFDAKSLCLAIGCC